ncbi:alpha-L-fucosidase [Pontiella sulfatireligans]|uniref:alpha-L-fucosidase n=1 Tax=Pontiella sulfatireligans TaxID=2750658 RepID=A0A6C2UHU6_9BACT|nr:alpha-L-fucosidase [Pontiella sulfatireligans]VGO18981.1 hypothetical protein SCARR_01035 [Pontiella sulfatireligans]
MKPTMRGVMLCAVMVSLANGGESGKIDYPQELSAEKQQTLEWFSESRFGMFIHWGLYSVPAGEYHGKKVDGIGEWIMKRGNIPTEEYEQFAEQFDPVKFDADAWVTLAKDAGMKYMLITTKHHDGFCLWDSPTTDYDVVDRTPDGQDVIKALSKACKKHDIQLCLYYSVLDWHHPDVSYRNRDAKQDFNRYVQTYMKPQLKELLGGEYGMIPMIWFDGFWEEWWKPEMGKEIYDYIKEISPSTIVNDRISSDFPRTIIGDYVTPEQNIPSVPTSNIKVGDFWETVLTMNNTWGYRKDDNSWKSDRELIRTLIEVASRGGNLTLNIGPKADGTIPQPSVDGLNAMGRWLKVNGEAVYGTSHSPIGMMPWGRLTTKGDDKVFLHIFEWPRDRFNMRLEQMSGRKIKRIYLLEQPEKSLEFVRSGMEVRFAVPQPCPDPIATVIAIEFETKRKNK